MSGEDHGPCYPADVVAEMAEREAAIARERDLAELQGHAMRVATRRIYEAKDERFMLALCAGEPR